MTARGPERKPEPLAWLDHTGALTPLPVPPAIYSSPRLSPDGSRVAVTVSNPDSDIWVYDVARGAATRITSDGKSLWPIWSSDGRRIAFSSTRGAASAIRSKRADGTGEDETLVETSFINIARCWSRSGVLGFSQVEPGTGADAWIREAGGRLVPVANTRFMESGACPSPDDRWLAVQSDRSGQTDVYVQPMPPAEGSQVRLDPGGGTMHSWSMDGREFYLTRGNEVWSVRTAEGRTGTFAEARLMLRAPFSLAGATPAYDIAADGRLLVVRRDAEAGRSAETTAARERG